MPSIETNGSLMGATSLLVRCHRGYHCLAEPGELAPPAHDAMRHRRCNHPQPLPLRVPGAPCRRRGPARATIKQRMQCDERGACYRFAAVKEERRGSPNDFAERLASHLARLREPGSPLPSDTDLIALVEATFFASLYEEETRRVELSVAWQPGTHDCNAVVAIAPPVRATPTNLTKVAPATWHEATSIAVRREGDALVAWALLERNATAHQPLTIRAL